MRPKDAVSEALRISLVDDEVVFLGEGAVNFSMTPDAARITLQRLADVLEQASVGPSPPRAAPIILMVEDEPLVRELGAAVLQSAGYVVIEAEGATEALHALEAEADIHLLFTDVRIPGKLNGLELAHLVNDRWPAIRLLIASGHLHPEPGQLPAKGRFLRKPYALTEMLRHVDELIAA
jgi:CheY-like chemotaxis protein